jgi:hypothetical protein
VGRCGGPRETACTGGRGEALHGIDGGDLAAGVYSPAGKLLTGNIGSLCEQQPLKALRAPSGPISQYKILFNQIRWPPNFVYVLSEAI